ncbi:MAG: 50S ribosomal protein L31e, partial [Candidatus Micrarchaeota archaeon]
MAKLERIYTVPLGEAYEAVRRKRTPRAVKILREFIGRHMKADGERIVLSQALNTHLWVRSIQKPPRRVKVRLIKDEGFVRAYLADEKVEEPKKKDAKEEKKETPKAEAKKEEAPKPEKKEAPKAAAQAP